MMILLATSGVASAGTDLIPDEKVLDELLKDDKLVKRFATVGHPLADEIELDDTCGSGAWFDLGFASYKQLLFESPFVVRLKAPIELHADQTAIGTCVLAWPTAELFGDFAFTPVGALIEAHTHADGSNSINAQIHAMGFVIDSYADHLPSGMTYSYSFGFQVPPFWGTQTLAAADLGVNLQAGQAFRGTVSFGGHLGGVVTVESASTGVQVRTLLSALPTALVGAELGSFVSPGFFHWSPLEYHLDVMRFLYGSRVQILPRSDGTWIADIAASTSMTDAMGMTIENVLDDDGNPVRKLVPLDYAKDLERGCKLELEFTPKLDPKADPKLSSKQ